MSYSRKYKVLHQNKVCIDNFSIVPIRFEDRFDIMRWRNEQMYHLRQSQILTEENQHAYFDKVIQPLFNQEKPEQILFSYLRGNECIGYGGLVHINWIDRNAEISFLINTKLETSEFFMHWSNFLELIEFIAYGELKFHKIYTYAFDLRPHLYDVLEKKGFTKEAVFKEHVLYNEEYKDVIIHSKIRKPISIRCINQDDIYLTFEWANDEKTRKNSFSTDTISFDRHVIWFSNKLNDTNAIYLICEVDNTPAALIRFDKQNDCYVVGLSIDKKFRGMKLAPLFLRIGLKYIYTELQRSNVIAFIKPNNSASIKSFQRAGFTFCKEVLINSELAYEYVYECQ